MMCVPENAFYHENFVFAKMFNAHTRTSHFIRANNNDGVRKWISKQFCTIFTSINTVYPHISNVRVSLSHQKVK